MNFVVLASEGHVEKTLWDPTLVGYLVFVSAIVVFVGSVILLLSTNLGVRQGFLVGLAGLFGLMMMLSAMWVTTNSPLNTLRGRIPAWEVGVQSKGIDPQNLNGVTDETDFASAVEKSAFDRVLSPILLDPTNPEYSAIKAAADERLVTKEAEGGVEPAPEVNEFAEYSSVDGYLVVGIVATPKAKPNPLKLEFRHSPQEGIVFYCDVLDQPVPFGDPPAKPKCDPEKKLKAISFVRDLGSLRQPPLFVFIGSTILFVLSLLGLHWREKDQRRAKETAGGPGSDGSGEGADRSGSNDSPSADSSGGDSSAKPTDEKELVTS